VKNLLLLRHAKSSWDEPALDDHDRPLSPRGVRAARWIASHLRERQLRPELVLSSSARRARQTLDAVQSVLDDAVDVQVDDELYGASADALVERLRIIDASIASVMVIGHNPGLEDLAVDLAGDGDPTALKQLHTKFPTAALAVLDLDQSEWARLGTGLGYLREIVLPGR
jgi:phosphohistidine phosphatase